MTVDNGSLSARVILAARIRRLRTALGMTQAELSEATGITRSHISAIENGRCNIRLDSVDKIARALGVPIQRLFDDEVGAEGERPSRRPLHIKERDGRYVTGSILAPAGG